MLIILAVVFRCVYLSLCLSCSEISVPGLNSEVYSSIGDINIGALFSITDIGKELQCTNQMRKDTFPVELVEALAFAVKKVNQNRQLLPQFKLGFFILDYCGRANTALAQSLSFLPARNSVRCRKSENDTHFMPPMQHYDVIGVIGLSSSREASLVSNLYSFAKLPLLNFMSTSDVLSDKATHPYFLRVVPPDIQQVLAMLTFISSNGWSFISIVYDEGPYGQNAFDHFSSYASNFGICFAFVKKVSRSFNADDVVKNLLLFPDARVVVLFGNPSTAKGVLKSSSRLKEKGHFIWIGSDAISDQVIHDKEIHKELIGSFMFIYYTREVDEFTRHFNGFTIFSSTNPWLLQFWELQGKCNFDNGSCAPYNHPTDFADFINSKSTSLVMDCVLTYAHATHRLIKEMCPFSRKSEIKKCVKGELLMKYLMNTEFDGYTGRIKFDSNGDYMGKYEIRQVKEMKIIYNNESAVDKILIEEAIGIFDIFTRKLKYNGHPISWDHLIENQNRKNETRSRRPTSLCSKPCGVGEYRVQLDIPCCWRCRQCRRNERVIENGALCETCEEFTWPDPDTGLTSCRPIFLQYTSIYTPIPMAEVCLASIAIFVLLVVIFFYFNNRDNRVIKASSRELSYLQMTGIMFGYISVIMFQMKPSDLMCGSLYFLYCLSFAWLYSPLIVKTVRIYRIFESAKHNIRPQFISPQAQLFFATVLIAVQVIICVVVYITYTPKAKKTHPNPMEKYVELSCDLTVAGIASFLAYNLVLVGLCSYFAFKTRRLPENFNESLFISMCVSTTLIVWLSFIATFLTANRGNVKVLLLSMSLLLNHTVAIVFLFIPKIYAVLVVDPTTISTFSPSLSARLHTLSMPKSLLSMTSQGSTVSATSLAKRRRSHSVGSFAEFYKEQVGK